ncbi:hypothetical protein K469DRAFT_706051 [Zopfia rhizophila CBS 207.26]|uniref:DUF2306 domain-containing protein n=1 Tax=Zopfia rhizophila CBS 207.26 TaxID=1314779 RepID=A0A6A6EUZ6_9PEZI|nr:hypothetical protein K469DRAFT_706051 [Zopfia rhizophila CBS 207.26]
MSEPTQQPSPNTFTRGARKIISPLGFRKGYNFVLFFIFAGAFVGFILARFQYLSLHGVLCNPDITGSNTAGPGECYYYLRNPYKVGILLHLGCVLPAGFLVVFQFLPVIRHKLILFHRLNGYLVLLLFLISTVGAFMIARHAFGGGLDVQSAVGVLGIMCVVSMALAYINIKRLQIEQHRAWMLRGWFYVRHLSPSPNSNPKIPVPTLC